jgi:hypothetical protein
MSDENERIARLESALENLIQRQDRNDLYIEKRITAIELAAKENYKSINGKLWAMILGGFAFLANAVRDLLGVGQ